MSLTLYQIADEYKELLNGLYDEETGLINEETMSRLNELDRPLQDKCINTVRAMKGLEAEYKAIEVERRAMQERERALRAKVNWIHGYLLENMEKSDIREISCPQFIIKLRKNPRSVHILSMTEIPEKYHKISISFDLIAIKDDLKAGIDVPGAILVQDNSLSIK